MKYSSRLLGMCAVLVALAFGSILSGCKDTASAPAYVDFGSIRVMEFVQGSTVPAITFIGYPNDNKTDTLINTPTPMSYGVATPYINNLSTNRGAGRAYHLQAINASNRSVIAETDVTLMPSDKYTWIIFEPDADGNYNGTLIADKGVQNASSSMAYFRLLNVNPDGSQNPQHLRVGDPVGGQELTPSGGIGFRQMSEYMGLPTALDTTVTFYVTKDDGTILGRLAGVSLSPGTYHTLVWGGQLDNNTRKVDFNGNHIPDDSIRIHIFDDNDAGNDILPVPVTLRYNLVNALVPPEASHRDGFVDYAAAGGLSVVLNNNTAFDHSKLMPFTAVPLLSTSGPVFNVVPRSVPYTGLAYFKFVKPISANAPSSVDSILFRFYATTQRIVSDQLVSIIVFDTVQSSIAALKAGTPYDSSKGVLTMPVPDQSKSDAVTIVLANTVSGQKSTATMMTGAFTINGQAMTGVKGPKTYDALTLPASPGGSISVTVDCTLNSGKEPVDQFTFNAEAGGIYEVLLVGERNRLDHDDRYKPQFMVVRTNPLQP